MRECYNEVEQEDEDRQSIVQDILRKKTHFLRRIIVPVEGHRGVTLSYVCLHSRPLEGTSGGSPLGTERSSAIGGVQLAASTMGRSLAESWPYKTARTAEMPKCFECTRFTTRNV